MKTTKTGIGIFEGGLASEIRKDEYEGSSEVVEKIFTTGINVLGGQPKHGKSNFIMQAAIALAQGSKLMDTFQSIKANVLYLSLEETRDLANSRLDRFGHLGTSGDDAIRFEFQFPSIKDGGVYQLINRMESDPATRVVVVDILQKFKGFDSKPNYSADYEALSMLHRASNELDVAVIFLHHTRKDMTESKLMNSLYGSFGLPGLADTCVLLYRPYDERGILETFSRKMPSTKLDLTFHRGAGEGYWTYVGSYNKTRLSDQARLILDFLAEVRNAIKLKEIAQTTGLSAGSVHNMLLKMKGIGLIEKLAHGHYYITDAGLVRAKQPW